MSFGTPQWFWALVSVPILILLFVRAEHRGARRLQEFVSARLLPNLAGTVNRFRRVLRFALLLLAFVCAVVSLARPQWGYTYEDVKRKGLDLILAVDTSRSMLSNDVQPSRLQRVTLAAQDLINEMQGDRVGLIAFAGRAFLQAPLTIDYDAAVEAINDLDTNTIPEGGTNISEAINLAVQTFGKSAIGNRAMIVFTDGEELSGDSAKRAKAATDAGVRIFTVGVGTPEGSLIPISGEGGGTAFVKDAKGQVVKSKLDEKRLKDIAEATGGFYLHLEDGPGTMKKLFAEGLGKMQSGEIDARMSRTPIERYQWPLGAAILALIASILVSERKRAARWIRISRTERAAVAAAALVLFTSVTAFADAPGLEAYRSEKFSDAYDEFQRTLKAHPETHAADKIEFDSGAAAYKMKDYGKALNSFSQALLSPESALQSRSHYNLGNTLYERGETQKSDEKKMSDWENALQHYEQTLKLDPKNKEAKDNYDYVKKKIEELKNKKQPQPSPTPTPSPSPKQDKKDQKQDQQKQDSSDKSQDQKQDQQKQDQQKQDQQKGDKNQKSQDGKDDNQKKDEQNPGESPSPSASPSPEKNDEKSGQGSPSPSPSAGGDKEQKQDGQSEEPQPSQTPTPAGEGNEAPSPSPSPGDGHEGEAGSSPTPTASPGKKLTGDVKGAPEDKSDKEAQVAEAEPEKEGEMSEKQAEALLHSMKGEEQRVQLDERKAARHVYNDW